MKRKRKPDTFVCPHCGADVAVGAAVCRECGSDDETGWSEDSDGWRANLPSGYGGDDDFDYDEYMERELPDQATPPPGSSLKQWALRAFIVVLCIALLRCMVIL